MRPTDPKDVTPTTAAAKSTAASVDEIRALEARLLSMKKDLLFSAATVDDGEVERSLSFLVVRVAGGLFAAPISQVDEVLEVPELTLLHEGVRTIAGLCNYHGQMLAVIDVAELSGGSPTAISAERVLVICTVAPRTFALLVDEALEVVAAEPRSVTLADEVMTGVLRSAGVLKLPDNSTAQIINLAWLAVGAQLATLLRSDAATPTKERGA
jgi:chemotaxis signal transduction protein